MPHNCPSALNASGGTPATNGPVGTPPAGAPANRAGPISAPTGTPGAPSNATPNTGNNPAAGQGEPATNAGGAGAATSRSGTSK